jgi:hypothetical protein
MNKNKGDYAVLVSVFLPFFASISFSLDSLTMIAAVRPMNAASSNLVTIPRGSISYSYRVGREKAQAVPAG